MLVQVKGSEMREMPKMKTHRGAAKRLYFTGSGKIARRRTNRRHKLTHKSSKRTRRLGKPTIVSSADERRIRRILPYS
jgi:large subunit ribosomal protein L35